ncbi:uncharacterized protein BO88DRAFT_427230 [Aspergillus vadensis CBS 113365]|uniref:Uncharacterized protein n=1 Tax=Aspergillus vadensis (strain CBS 113365 / IMI 142717 / IBT 24658) TaxID=1448311 RepID=A0A319CF94_ASPVC|nr:hypothetical protein BO88DRAFT_427230 [Aspergillus vadensis CBS 113365]PYH67022.1 hypothetical protein BO88DRAFT_427230 [Aspergillus vadensis CBS 113365]
MDFDTQISYHDGLILGLIYLFKIFYFIYFISPGAILKAQVVTFYNIKVLLWELYLRSIYLSSLTNLAISKISTIPAQTSDSFWILVLLIYILQTQESPPPLTINLIRIAMWSLLAAASCAAHIPEWLGIVRHWHLSLYAMHLILVWNSISYAQGVWDMVL